jgi:hypothetical protein
MKFEFDYYEHRPIAFLKTVEIGDWSVKLYSITHKSEFDSILILPSVLQILPKCIEIAENSNLPIQQQAFVIIHEAREGYLILFNWWTGGEMLETKVYFSSYEKPEEIDIYPYHPKSLVCIWELEIFAHERKAWIHHVLKNAKTPHFKGYVNDYYVQEL